MGEVVAAVHVDYDAAETVLSNTWFCNIPAFLNGRAKEFSQTMEAVDENA